MTDYQPVKPRITAPDMLPAGPVTPAPAPPPPPAAPGVMRGLFTSMYENKVIVLIIIAVIVIIGFFAYVMMRNPDADERPRARQRGEPTTAPTTAPPAVAAPTAVAAAPAAAQPPPPVAATAPAAAQPAAPPAAVAAQAAAQPAAAPRSNLAELYTKSKQAEARLAQAPPVVANTKSDEEIRALMEDDEVATEPAAAITGAVADSVDGTVDTVPTQCDALLKSGKQCRNRPRSNGKCQVHGG